MKSVMDLHTHTLASGHAYNSMREMASAAAEKGLEVLGITEHAPAMPGTCQAFYFQNLKVVPREMYGIRLLLGAELNIVDYDGTVDLEARDLKRLDIAIASLHLPCIKPGTAEENTRAYLKAMENPYVNIIGHPDDGRFPVNHEALVEGAKKWNKIIEINNNSLSPLSFRSNAEENDLEILKYCREYKVPVVLSSDAHIDVRIGDFEYALSLLEKAGFPEELVLNRSMEALEPFLHN